MLKRKTQSERSQAMIELINQATSKVLVKRGYSKTTTNHIANTAGISIGSLYRYFKNKEEAVQDLLKKQTNLSENLLLKELEQSQHLDLQTLTKKAVSTLFEFYCEHETLWSVFYNQLPRDGKYNELNDHFNRASLLIESFLSDHEGHYQVKNIKLAGSVVVHSMVGAFFGTDKTLKLKPNRSKLLNELEDLVTLYLFTKRG